VAQQLALGAQLVEDLHLEGVGAQRRAQTEMFEDEA
jgi:hypothetical protein